MTYSIEIAMDRISMQLGDWGERPVIARFATRSVLEFAEQLTASVEYFKSAMKADSDIGYIAILIREYQDHTTIVIQRDADGSISVVD